MDITPIYPLLLDSDPTQGVSQRLTLDPITRIEGHLRIDTEVADGTIRKAWSSATLFRGIELVLQSRDPRDAPLITQRLCGVCTYVHLACATTCIENAWGVVPPGNARLIRNLLMGAQFLHDHIVHFYHLHALDWVDLASALTADVTATGLLASQANPYAATIDFGAVKTRLATFATQGQLGPFTAGYFGHPAYKLSPEGNLLLVAHYLQALKIQAKAAKMMAIFGGKNPHPQSVVVGGVTCASEMGNQARFDAFAGLLAEVTDFIDTVYLPDVAYLASVYPEWATYGGCDNFLAYGEFPLDDAGDALLSPRGAIFERNLAGVTDVDLSQISEHVARSWYAGETDRHPAQGVTEPIYTGYDGEARYSWLKAPRYFGEPMEVGPLARVLVAYARGSSAHMVAVNAFLNETGLTTDALFSVLGRTAARAIETQVIAAAMADWLAEVQTNLNTGRTQVFTGYTAPTAATGVGLGEAPRGALGHWLRTAGGTVANYQLVVPSAWNFGPRCSANKESPVESSLAGIPIADVTQPLEVLRLVHSFDPCIACGVHLIDVRSGEEATVKVR